MAYSVFKDGDDVQSVVTYPPYLTLDRQYKILLVDGNIVYVRDNRGMVMEFDDLYFRTSTL